MNVRPLARCDCSIRTLFHHHLCRGVGHIRATLCEQVRLQPVELRCNSENKWSRQTLAGECDLVAAVAKGRGGNVGLHSFGRCDSHRQLSRRGATLVAPA